MTIKELYERAVELECENLPLCLDLDPNTPIVSEVLITDVYEGKELEVEERPSVVVIKAYDEVQA